MPGISILILFFFVPHSGIGDDDDDDDDGMQSCSRPIVSGVYTPAKPNMSSKKGPFPTFRLGRYFFPVQRG